MVRIALIIIGLAFAGNLNGQDISTATLKWTASGFRDLDTDKDFGNSCQFITYGNDKVEWIQDNGNYVNAWNVSQAQGSWADVKTAGTYGYQFSDGTISGEITIQKSGTGWQLDLVIVGGTSDIKLKYTITSVEKL